MDGIWAEGPYLQKKPNCIKANASFDETNWKRNALNMEEQSPLSTSLPNLLAEFEESPLCSLNETYWLHRKKRQQHRQVAKPLETQSPTMRRHNHVIRRPLPVIAPVTHRFRPIPEQSEDSESGIEDNDDSEINQSVMMARCVRDWLIPLHEIEFAKRAAGGRRRSIYSGRWHGRVVIHTFEPLREPSIQDFLKFVTPLSTLRHENILLFMGICTEPQCLAVLTSATRGPSLFDLIHLYQDCLILTEQVRIGRQIAQAMGYLHSKNVVHGCLSTRNIFLDSRVKVSLIDYGLVDSRLDRSGYGCFPGGQLKYLSPELITSIQISPPTMHIQATTTQMSDVFAFGTVCYELMTGSWPFPHTDAHIIIWQVGNGHSQCLNNIKGPASSLKELVSSCWEATPCERPHFTKIISEFNYVVSVDRRTTS